MSRPASRINIRVPIELKARLEQEASKENMEFSAWLRLNLPKLEQEYPGRIYAEESIPVPIPRREQLSSYSFPKDLMVNQIAHG
jgi:hypothetical protein